MGSTSNYRWWSAERSVPFGPTSRSTSGVSTAAVVAVTVVLVLAGGVAGYQLAGR